VPVTIVTAPKQRGWTRCTRWTQWTDRASYSLKTKRPNNEMTKWRHLPAEAAIFFTMAMISLRSLSFRFEE
jgi:hypothetical protein